MHLQVLVNYLTKQPRLQPEVRFDLVKPLIALRSKPSLNGTQAWQDDQNFGEIHFIATYTEDCFHPSCMSALFCNSPVYCSSGPALQADPATSARSRAYRRANGTERVVFPDAPQDYSGRCGVIDACAP